MVMMSADAGPFSPLLVEHIGGEPEAFWAAAAAHRLVVQRCNQCGLRLRPGVWTCPGCLSIDLVWVDAAGTGTIYTLTAVHQLYHPEFADRRPYWIGLVDLDEGPRVVTRVLGDGPTDKAPVIGDRVGVAFVPVGDRSIPCFRVTDREGGGDGE